jgi:hypothetical protein
VTLPRPCPDTGLDCQCTAPKWQRIRGHGMRTLAPTAAAVTLDVDASQELLTDPATAFGNCSPSRRQPAPHDYPGAPRPPRLAAQHRPAALQVNLTSASALVHRSAVRVEHAFARG